MTMSEIYYYQQNKYKLKTPQYNKTTACYGTLITLENKGVKYITAYQTQSNTGRGDYSTTHFLSFDQIQKQQLTKVFGLGTVHLVH